MELFLVVLAAAVAGAIWALLTGKDTWPRRWVARVIGDGPGGTRRLVCRAGTDFQGREQEQPA